MEMTYVCIDRRWDCTKQRCYPVYLIGCKWLCDNYYLINNSFDNESTLMRK